MGRGLGKQGLRQAQCVWHVCGLLWLQCTVQVLPRPVPLGSRLRTPPGTFPALDCYLLLLFHVGGDGSAMCSPSTTKRDFRPWLVIESGAQVVLSSIFPVPGSYMGWNRWDHTFKTWLHAGATNSFGSFNNGMGYTAPDILVSDGIRISQRGREVFPHELVGLSDRALI